MQGKGNLNRGEPCGEWIEDGETVTYDPCPPDLEDGNSPPSVAPSHTQLSTVLLVLSCGSEWGGAE